MKIADKLESCDKNFFHEITIRAVCVKRKPIEDIKKIQNLLARSKKLSNQINSDSRNENDLHQSYSLASYRDWETDRKSVV